MPSKLSSCVIGIDVGGTNTDAVILQNEAVLALHKTPTTADIQSGVERAIDEVVNKAGISLDFVDSVKIGTTVSVEFCVQYRFKSRKLFPCTRQADGFLGCVCVIRRSTSKPTA